MKTFIKKTVLSKLAVSLLVVLLPTLLPASANAADDTRVYTLSNNTSANQVLEFDALLNPLGVFSTRGLGTGGGLGNQGALVSHEISEQQALLGVNPGSGSWFVLFPKDGTIVTTSSGGARPISVIGHGNRFYVVHADGTLAAFKWWDGGLVQTGNLAQTGSITLPTGGAPAEVGVTPNGRTLVVTLKATNQIVTVPVSRDGTLGTPIITASSGQTPFGFTIVERHDENPVLVVSEAFGGTASALSSYEIKKDATLRLITGSLAAPLQRAACWVVQGKGGQLFVTNTATNSMSTYKIMGDGVLKLLNAAIPVSGVGPIDIATASTNAFVLERGIIEKFSQVGAQISSVGNVTVPAGSNGLVAVGD